LPVGVPDTDDTVGTLATTVAAPPLSFGVGVEATVFVAVEDVEDEAVLSEPQAESNAISSKRLLTTGINKILFIIFLYLPDSKAHSFYKTFNSV